MLVDASVARSFGVIGWTRYLLQVGGGTIFVADGVQGQRPGDPSELRNIRIHSSARPTWQTPAPAWPAGHLQQCTALISCSASLRMS